MKFYFIRHAPTSANLSGSMVAGYENTDINLYDKPDDWEERVGKFIPEADRKVIVRFIAVYHKMEHTKNH